MLNICYMSFLHPLRFFVLFILFIRSFNISFIFFNFNCKFVFKHRCNFGTGNFSCLSALLWLLIISSAINFTVSSEHTKTIYSVGQVQEAYRIAFLCLLIFVSTLSTASGSEIRDEHGNRKMKEEQKKTIEKSLRMKILEFRDYVYKVRKCVYVCLFGAVNSQVCIVTDVGIHFPLFHFTTLSSEKL